MKLIYLFIQIIFSLFLSNLTAAEITSRPCELQFYVDSHLNTSTVIIYNSNGDVIKMSSYEKGKLTDYARYKYNTDGILISEKTYNHSNVLLRTRNYFYDDSGAVTSEKVYTPSGDLIEYLIISNSNRKIQKIDYHKSDDILYQTIEFKYNNKGLLKAMVFNKIGKYIMIMKPVYDKNMRLTGHGIVHSNADVKIETKYIYEEGYATEEALSLIFR